MTQTVLFLCTGNYDRSRFAELYFNHLAVQAGIPWRAVSRGLATELGKGLIGPMSPYVRQRMLEHGVTLDPNVRQPLQLTTADLDAADLVVALDRSEHLPWVRLRFAPYADRIRYWSVPDLHLLDVDAALTTIEASVAALIAELQNGDLPAITS